jgi:hypothetical protein
MQHLFTIIAGGIWTTSLQQHVSAPTYCCPRMILLQPSLTSKRHFHHRQLHHTTDDTKTFQQIPWQIPGWRLLIGLHIVWSSTSNVFQHHGIGIRYRQEKSILEWRTSSMTWRLQEKKTICLDGECQWDIGNVLAVNAKTAPPTLPLPMTTMNLFTTLCRGLYHAAVPKMTMRHPLSACLHAAYRVTGMHAAWVLLMTTIVVQLLRETIMMQPPRWFLTETAPPPQQRGSQGLPLHTVTCFF